MTAALKPHLTSIRPMLAVTDLQRTMEFYTRKLGFSVGGTFGEPGQPPVWCSLHRDGQEIMFNAPPRESIIRDVPLKSKDYQIYYCCVDNVAALHDEFRSRGVKVSDLRVTVYRMKEFELRDPDGYWLWFGQETDESPTVED